MTTHTFQIRADQLSKIVGSVLPMASKDRTLGVLSGVLLRRQDNYLTATATDRYVIGICRDSIDPNLTAPSQQWRCVIDLAAAKDLLTTAKREQNRVIVVEQNDDRIDFVSIGRAYQEIEGPVDGKNVYPEVGRLVSSLDGVTASLTGPFGLDIERVAQFLPAQKIAHKADRAFPRMWGSDAKAGGAQIVIRIGEDFIGTVMGMRLPGDAAHEASITDWEGML